MSTTEATRLLEQFRAGKVSREKVLRTFQAAPVADLGFAQVDTHRALRKNDPIGKRLLIAVLIAGATTIVRGLGGLLVEREVAPRLLPPRRRQALLDA